MKSPSGKSFLTGFGILAILLTIIPYFSTDYWWIRMFDFPHLQLSFLTLIAILVYFFKFNFKSWKDYLFIGLLISCFVFQFGKIYPYTAFAAYEVLPASKSQQDSITIYTANVLQKNEKRQTVVEQLIKYEPDIVLLTEVNKPWENEISQAIGNNYPFKIQVPKDNTYGMLLYSKNELINPKVKYLVSDSIPSIHTKVKMIAGDTIQIYAIHPTPPMPQENPLSTDRDTEMMMVAKMALDSQYPVLVIGDFNDVAWSVTSKLFQNVSRLGDIRKGRGLYNTYDANNFLLRWPLDHIFISNEFRLQSVKRCEDIHSDHFPLYTTLSFEPENKLEQELPPPTDDELKRVEDQINAFKKNNK